MLEKLREYESDVFVSAREELIARESRFKGRDGCSDGDLLVIVLTKI